MIQAGQLSEEDEEGLISFFQHFVIEDKSRKVIEQKLQDTVHLRRTWLENPALEVHKRFSFFFAEPTLVSYLVKK